MSELEERECPVCHAKFSPVKWNQTYCSQACKGKIKRLTAKLRADAARQARKCALPECGREFMPRNGNQKYCSTACMEIATGRHVSEEHKAKNLEQRECPECHKRFIPRTPNAIFCCAKCGSLYRYREARKRIGGWEPTPRECQICHTTFLPSLPHALYCSPECSRIGHNRQRAQQRRDVREGARAERTYPPKPCAECGKIFTPQGRPMAFCSDECRIRNYSKKAHSKEHEKQDAPRQTAFGLNVDPYTTGRLRSDALYCPVI